nr:uroporphyrinogen decarboxylase family protein [bacterium]
MTGKERISRQLKRQSVDRIGVYEAFWEDTQEKWAAQGHVGLNENLDEHFGFDISICSPFNLVADIDFVPQVLDETEDTILKLDGNGAKLRRHKKHSSTPEHVGFTVTDRESWEAYKPLLVPDERRIDFEGYARAKEAADKAGRFFCWAGVNVFECMHPITGHENMLIGMADDPEWLEDMIKTYSDLTLGLQEILFAREGQPDGIWYWEDMGFKERPFFSPRMYKELIFPAHQRTIAFAHERGMPVIMHSCGYVEPLLPGMVEAGIDCLQVLEVKAGMDLIKIYKDWGDRLSLMGGIDVRTLYSNDKKIIDAELEKKIPIVKQNNGFILHSDHSIPYTVDYDTYRYFIKKGLELGTY